MASQRSFGSFLKCMVPPSHQPFLIFIYIYIYSITFSLIKPIHFWVPPFMETPKYLCIYIFEGSLEVELPTIRTDGKAEVGRVREEQKRSEKITEEKK